MRNKKLKIIFVILILAGAAIFLQQKMNYTDSGREVIKEIKPKIGAIRNIISSTATVQPKNRLEIKPPVNGRIEQIFVQEGEEVKVGQVLAQMSSTERAAMLDAAVGKGEEATEYWKEVYKAISLISPIDAEVIVAKTQPGQTVTTADAVVVLSDQLIIRAQLDETDIGKIKLGQDAVVALDAYPDTEIKAIVEHIYYESKIVNNVTMYEVDLLLADVPQIMRSGMNTSVDFIQSSKENVLLIPSEAVLTQGDKTYVLVRGADNTQVIKQPVELGMSDETNVEVISGLKPQDTVLINSEKYSSSGGRNPGNSPFMPFGRRR
ncbi:MAG: HlyD family efflux transporter periplasmic adaptor subunit [Candidatus Omnitrophica bacterium]|nr:HlyD family efflux transporter periplasmic adaptor subunit [Candidatus Omnitrophota bacterium]MCG2706183.1 HlyD family efflux transporter periplasmic adaptor subunit [Candidatus Omnitrophota bacterium]